MASPLVTYSLPLVSLSYVVAVVASLTALELTHRVATSHGVARRIWLGAGALSMGVGIWTMHFIGMLAADMGMPLEYDVPITLASLAAGAAASAFAIHVASKSRGASLQLIGAGVALGIGICAMHYTGMAAMRMPAMRIEYETSLFLASVLIAVAAATAALWISGRLAVAERRGLWKLKVGAALVMGLAICGMHYTGMAAAIYVPDATVVVDVSAVLPAGWMAGALAIASLLILSATHLTLFFDYKLGTQERLRADMQALAEQRTLELRQQAAALQASKDQLVLEAEQNRQLSLVVETATDAICILTAERTIEYVNRQFEREFGYSLAELKGRSPIEMGWTRSDKAVYEDMHLTLLAGRTWSGVLRSVSRDGKPLDHECNVSPLVDDDGNIRRYVQIRRNITERLRLEQQLRHAQKLESIGQLAAGIAHEINTPSQYVGDNTRFLKDAFADLSNMCAKVKTRLAQENDATQSALGAILAEADVDYLLDEIPKAIDQTLDGIDRVTRIVKAMKEFSHPAQDKTSVDLNRAIESTVTVATNEWKYVAEMSLELDPALPNVPCVPGDINQVVLNIVVNAAHAIADANQGTSARGKITITTRRAGEFAEIRIADTGTGIPEAVRSKIFDPFFTTKDVGRGTGQGLSIAHSIVVDRHKGSLDFETTLGSGTCFIVRLPLVDDSAGQAGIAA